MVLTLWLLYQFMNRMSAKYAWAWQKLGTYEELQVLSDSPSETRVTHCCCRLYLWYECTAGGFNHAKYFCWKRSWGRWGLGGLLYVFCLGLKKFIQIFVVCFCVHPWLLKWVCGEGLIMLPLEVNIKSWFASFVGLSKRRKKKHLGHFHS